MTPLIRQAGPISVNRRRFSADYLSAAIQRDRGGYRKPPTTTTPIAAKARTHPRENSDPSRLRNLLRQLADHYGAEELPNLTPMLPLLGLKGKPLTLADHFVFEPFFRTERAKQLLYKTARQTGKTLSSSAAAVLQCATLSHFTMLFVTPLYEMARRVSNNYVRPLIEQSPAKRVWLDSDCPRHVLQRGFRNGSSIHFSYAWLDADRTRGIPCDANSTDEAQDMDPAFGPIIRETLGGSPYAWEQFTGTPKTLNNPMQRMWDRCSQAEFHIWCQACGKENIPSLGFDLDAMIGPSHVTREVSNESPGVVCARCGRPLNPRDGSFVHHFPERRLSFPGYHVPQIIMPGHYSDPEKWAMLLGKRDGVATPTHVFYNEVCGESYDSGSRLVTKTELMNASTRRPNTLDYAESVANDYVLRVLSVDWGGGGQSEQSYTAIAVLGFKGDGRIDVLYGHRFKITHAAAQEVWAVMHVFQRCRCHYLVHDLGGQGDLREQMLINGGFPHHLSCPVSYARACTGPIVTEKPANPRTGMRGYYLCDKSRSLSLTCELIRYKKITFFEYDGNDGQPSLIDDFMALIEDEVSTLGVKTIFTIIRDEKAGTDDFAQAVNIGCMFVFYHRRAWPDLASIARFSIDPTLLASVAPQPATWNMFE